MPVIVGLDCGGSSTRILAKDGEAEIHRGQSGSANLLSTPRATLLANIERAAAGCPRADLVCGCFAGLVNEETKAQALDILSRVFPGASVRAEPDYAAALAACGPMADACVIAGTGSIVCSRGPEGLHKTGGRGPLLQDPGSAAEIGRELLSLILDGDHPVSDKVLADVEKVFGTADAAHLVARVYQSKAPAAAMAKLVKPAAKESERGNSFVSELLVGEMRELAAMVSRHVTHFLSQQSTITLGLAGGLWRSHSLYVQMFNREVTNLMPSSAVDTFILATPPVEGALRLAGEMLLGN